MIRKLFPLACLLAVQGCLPWWLFDEDDDDVAPPAPSVPVPPTAVGPSIDSFDVPTWPPLGPTAEIEAFVSSDVTLSQLELTFFHRVVVPLSGTSDSVRVSGSELGEGFGTLRATLTDTRGAQAIRAVDNLLIDLTPPEIFLGETVLRPDGSLELWIADAWVIGDVTLLEGSTVLSHRDFDDGYPPTLGSDWDYALVSFPAAHFSEGVTSAKLLAHDAAGNEASLSFDVEVDGTAPEVVIDQPSQGATVSGVFEVQVAATDAGSGPLWIALYAGGTSAATAVGPTAVIQLDAADFPAGPLTLTAVARDKAGNEATSAEVTVLVE